MQLISMTLVHWIVIYPVDSAIHLLNNWGLSLHQAMVSTGCVYVAPCSFVIGAFRSSLFTKETDNDNAIPFLDTWL